ncbi:phytanoyl-CoA dioxygenase family protein [Mycobacterium yunnanensis]|uniref:Phytanoyl-CoA dioxygenase family protein n=1 Tax=Mycobacterium yunnanensis TaxID=368477 RepID=A0A9X3C189_9MYCO|nr:phytanoyl-CoA dioxygenase family protein [Mycobacterium yunnanensis]MCV7419047.1 phytanoyl-CoA dioxygenase family protein [Mycobacterium yunnanensis]
MIRNPHLSEATAAGTASDVAVEWDRGNDQWWDWYMSLADGPVPDGPLVDPPAHDPGPLPTDDEVTAELAKAYPITDEQIARFRTEAFVKLPGVLSPGTVERLRIKLRAMLDEAVDADVGFQSREMMWLDDDVVRAAVLSPRLGGISAALLGTDRVRLYHDNALSKEPGAGRTPWHYDAHHFPLDSPKVLTAWIPLQPTPREMGPLAFARGADVGELVDGLEFDKHGTSYDRGVSEILRTHGVQVEDGPFAAGEVSFHGANCFHTAGANRTTAARVVLANTYFADGVRVVPSPTMVSGDWRKFIPGAEPGEVVASPRNPLLARPV